MRHKPLNIKTFRPLKSPIKTWVWCIRVDEPIQEKDNAIRKRYNTSVAWFAEKILKAWPSLENFEFVRLGSRQSIIYTLDESNQLVQREQQFDRRLSWDLF